MYLLSPIVSPSSTPHFPWLAPPPEPHIARSALSQQLSQHYSSVITSIPTDMHPNHITTMRGMKHASHLTVPTLALHYRANRSTTPLLACIIFLHVS